MLYVFALLLIIFIFPLILTIYIYFDTKIEKVFFAVYIFGFIKIVDGYITKRDLGGVYIHFKNKAIIVDEFNFNSIQGGKSVFKLLQVIAFDSYINLSTNSFSLYYLTILLNFIKNITFNFLNSRLILQTPKASVDLTLGQFELQVKWRVKILFNLFCITYYFITNYIIKGVQNVKATK